MHGENKVLSLDLSVKNTLVKNNSCLYSLSLLSPRHFGFTIVELQRQRRHIWIW